MVPFSYAAASSIQAAFDLASRKDAMFIAGGTDMLQLLQDDVVTPSTVVDINRLPFAGVQVDDDGARIGALTRLSDVADDEHIQHHYPVLVEALRETASPQVRNMATAGGNLLQRTRCLYFRDKAAPCNKRAPGSGCGAIGGQNRMNAILGGSESCIAAYPGDMAAALVALDASLHVQGPDGPRVMHVEDLHRLPEDRPDFDTNLLPGELISAILLPPARGGVRSHYLKLRDRASFEWALVGVAALLEVDGDTVSRARLAATGVGTVPWRLRHVERSLTGQRLDLQSVRAASMLAAEGATPREHNEFKVLLLKRAVERAILSAGGLA
jgi:xanthine dehydrogenase YagS FAD-binding subunit